MKIKDQSKMFPFVKLILLILVIGSILVTTKLVQKSQGNRSSAASFCKCSKAGYGGSAYICSTNGGTWKCTNTTPTCTSFTYGVWGACNHGRQTRTIKTKSPSGCTGGSPTTSRSCTSTKKTGKLSCSKNNGKCVSDKSKCVGGTQFANQDFDCENGGYCCIGGEVITTKQTCSSKKGTCVGDKSNCTGLIYDSQSVSDCKGGYCCVGKVIDVTDRSTCSYKGGFCTPNKKECYGSYYVASDVTDCHAVGCCVSKVTSGTKPTCYSRGGVCMSNKDNCNGTYYSPKDISGCGGAYCCKVR